MGTDARRFLGLFTIHLCITLIAYGMFAIGSFLHLSVLLWLIGPPNGPLWVGFLSPIGFAQYLFGLILGLIAYRVANKWYVLIIVIFNGALCAAYLVVLAIYIVMVGLIA